MNEVEFLKQLIDAGVATMALIALIALVLLGVPALRIFNSQQKRNGETLTTVANIAKGLQQQNAATQRDLDSAQAALTAERTTSHERIDMLAQIMENVAQMARDAASALSRHEGKLDHIDLTTGRIEESSKQRLALLQQVVHNQKAANTRLGDVEQAVTNLVEVVTSIDGRTERSEEFISALTPLPKTLEIVTLVLQGKLDEAVAAQKRSTGMTMAVADG